MDKLINLPSAISSDLVYLYKSDPIDDEIKSICHRTDSKQSKEEGKLLPAQMKSAG